MKDSGYDSNTAIIPRRASGYMPSPKGAVNAGYIHMSIPHAAGALYSTTEDLLRWEQALFGGKIVSAESLRKMTTAFKNNYALGVTVQTANGKTAIQHGGGIDGFNTFLSYYPDDKLTVAVLSNINGTAPGAIANKLAAVVHGEPVPSPADRKEGASPAEAPGPRKEITVPASTLSKYPGTYELRQNVVLTVTLESDYLMAQLTGQPRFPIYAASETLFFYKIVDATLEFQKDASGATTGVRLKQGPIDQVLPKK
jgi:hypothetical protein